MPGDERHRRRAAFDALTQGLYWVVVVEVCFLLAAAPGLAGILFLERDASNIPLYALCLLPLGPAFSATIATMDARRSAEDLAVWPRFWRAYARNIVDVLWIWIPALILASVLGTTIAFGAAAGIDEFFTGAAVVILIAVAAWAFHGVVIATMFRFRARDRARLALFYIAAKPIATFGALACLVIAAAIVAFTSDWVLVALAPLFAVFALLCSRPMLADIRERFIG